MIVFSFQAYGQKAKDLKRYNVKTRTVVKTIEKGGESFSYNEIVENFNKEGKTMSKIEYYKNGKIKNKNIYKYDNFGNVVEEEEYNDNKGVNCFYKYSYNADGNKIGEIKKDSVGNIIEKSTYTYDNRGLRKEKKEYYSDGKLKSARKISYEYYK